MPRMWGLSSQAQATQNDLSPTPPSVNRAIVRMQSPRKGHEARLPLLVQGKGQAAFPSSPRLYIPSSCMREYVEHRYCPMARNITKHALVMTGL